MRLIGIFWILMICTAAFAGGMDTIIVPPSAPQSGQTAEFSLYVHNTGRESISVHLPPRLSCRIESADRAVEVSATATQPFQEKAAVVREGGFVKGRYAFTVPEDLEGPVRMEVREFETAGVMFLVGAAAPSKTPRPAAGGSGTAEEYVTLDSLFKLYQPSLVNFSAYEPLYFLVGTDPKRSKFQISFKYRLFHPEGGLGEEFPWLEGLNLGYTQTSFWDLKSASVPFEDTSYKPELFFVSPNLKVGPAWMKGFFIQTGFQHESNGRGNLESRSTNFLYAKPIFIFYDPETRYGLQFSPKIWVYIGNDDKTNPDLKDYRGYFELEMKLGKKDGFVLGSNLRWADQGVSVQLDLTYPIRQLLFRNVGFYFQIQYVNALAESLLNFRERTEALRLGISIVR